MPKAQFIFVLCQGDGLCSLLTVSKLEGYLPGDNVTTAQPVPLSVDPQRTAVAATCVRMIVAKASQLWRGMKPTTTAESRAV